jgi:two-component system, sensor histidine kinase and response regulator
MSDLGQSVYVPTVLVVDDNPNNLKLCSQLLSSLGLQVRIAMDGLGGLEAAKNSVPDLILLDINMPHMDGYETCRRLKAMPELREIPVIFVSAMGEEMNKTLAFELGAVDYLTKPIPVEEAKARIMAHLRLHRQTQELATQAQAMARSYRQQQELLQVIAHDLANPLGAISMAVDIHRRKLGDSNYLQLISKAVGMATALITDLRTLQRVAIKEVVLAKIDLSTAVADAQMICNERFNSKQILLINEIPAELSIVANHQAMTMTVLPNLFTNAIKFSEPGSMVHLSAREEGKYIVLAIADRGIGMSPEILATVFDVGKSKSRQGTQQEQGTGFGMPLVKSLVEAFGGSISISSKDIQSSPDDHGTVMELYLLKG